MNAWFRFSRLIFKLLLTACLFLIGAWVGSTIVANWKLFAIIAIVATIALTIVWLVGKFSAGQNQIENEDE